MSGPTRCLLDKVTARRILEGLLKRAERRDVNRAELFALDLYQRARSSEIQLFIVPATNNVLQGLTRAARYAPLIELLLHRSQVVHPTRYFTRWARRLRDHGFTREDAAVLALATFGTDDAGSILGMQFVATCDQSLINNWVHHEPTIQLRLEAMCRDLSEPYRRARLPEVGRPETIRLF